MKTLLYKPYFLIPLILAGISVNGTLLFGGLWLVGRVLAPESSTKAAEIKPQLLPVQPIIRVASPQVKAAAEPVMVRLQDGLNLGYKAAIMAKTARSSDGWAKVSLKWTEAVRKLEEIPDSSSEYGAAQKKIAEYLMNARLAGFKGEAQDIASQGGSVNVSGAPVNQSVAQKSKYRNSSVNAPGTAISNPTGLMDGRVSINSADTFPELSQASNKYKEAADILAYLQSLSMRETSISRNLPWLIINGKSSCKPELSIGVYYGNCSLIGVDFSDGNSNYEKAEEVVTAIAHEWGHHLAKIGNLRVSKNEGEIVSDCFAGLAMGFYYKQGMTTFEEVRNAADMMIKLGNNSSEDIHPNSETRFRAFLGAVAAIAAPNSRPASDYRRYCASLDQILDKNKIATAGY